MRLKITAVQTGGTLIRGQDVRVVDADTGQPLEGVQAITWHCGGRRETPICVIRMLGVELDLLADIDPAQVSMILLAQGEDA